MNPFRLFFVSFGLCAVLAPAHALAPINLTRLQQINDRINQLYPPHSGTTAPLNPLYNPFRIGAASALTDDQHQGSVAPVITDDESLLRQAAATLKVGGVIELNGTLRLSINNANYGVGNMLPVRLESGVVFLRVAAIAPRSVTLHLNAAELVLTF